jgi:glyoxylase-like metal-dependent hydrolase (beta-lactamase superfamily II)
MTAVTKLSLGTRPGTWHLSLPFQNESGILGPYVLAGQNDVALIDPGPSTTVPALLASLQEVGFEPQDVTHLLLTHIHLDHAGATGELVHRMPKATIYVHSSGAPHLVDPTKFIASATRIYGNKMQELWGNIDPVPADRIHAIEGGNILNVAGRRLEIHYTPGHAIHHVVFFDVHTGELFTGDIAGVRLQDINYVRPPTPPPDLDLEAWSASIHKLKQLRPDILYLAHCGPAEHPTQILDHLREKLISWGDIVLHAMRERKSEQEISDLLAQKTEPEVLRITGDRNVLKRLDLTANYAMTVQGYMRYWRKRHPERLDGYI